MKEDIICIAPNPWNDLWYRRQQLMSRFARKGLRVLYIEPQRSFLTPFVDKQTTGRNPSIRFGLRKEYGNLYVYAPINPIPFSRFRLFDLINDAFVHTNIRWVIRRLKIKRSLLWMYYTPKTASIVHQIKQVVSPLLICYDCFDQWGGHSGASPSEKSRILAEEKELIQLADLAFVVSEPLYNEKKLFNANTYMIPNGVDLTFYENNSKINIPLDIANISHPIIGYMGKIASNKFDMELIEFVARNRPDWSVVLIGPVFPEMRGCLPDLGNIYFLGEKSLKIIPAYLKTFDVGIIPYLWNEKRRYSNAPLKLWEYLAAGKPIVATRFSPHRILTEFVRIATTPEEFVNSIEKCLAEDDLSLVNKRINIARQNSWDRRVDRLLELITMNLGKKKKQ